MSPYKDEVELCQAQYCVPKPDALLPVAVAITYCVDAFEPVVVLPKWAAAFTASEASCDWLGLDGAVEPLSDQTPVRIPAGLPAAVPAPLQKYVRLATPWQYCVTLFSHELPPTLLRKFCRIDDSPDGSLLVHCEPQR